jgi:nitroreductase
MKTAASPAVARGFGALSPRRRRCGLRVDGDRSRRCRGPYDRKTSQPGVLPRAVGMFLQTLVLALTARGLGTCVQVAIAGYPEIVREQLNIPEELMILCGLAAGYTDAIEKTLVFLDS